MCFWTLLFFDSRANDTYSPEPFSGILNLCFFFFYLVKMPKRGNSFHNGIERSIIYSGLAFSKLSTDASTVFH